MVMVLFWNEKIIMHLLFRKWKKHIFWMNFQPKKIKIEMVLIPFL
jgi:hypothetical protein